MGGPRKNIEAKEMKKPKWKVGEIVNFEFIGKQLKGEILELSKNPQHIERWIYKILAEDGIKYNHIGVDGSEKYSNIWSKDLNKNLDNTNE